MLPFVRLGPFLLQLSGLALLAGVWAGSSLAEKEARRVDLDPASVYNLIFYGLISGVLGARLAYALRYATAYLANPLGLLALTPATLSPGAGLLIGLGVAALLARRWRLALRPTLDALAPGLAAFMVALALAHLLSGDAFGAPARLPWSIYLWDEYRHPTQFYEMAAALAVLVVVLRRPFGRPGGGHNFVLAVALSSAARVFLEAFRGDSVLWAGGFRAAQVVGLLVLAACVVWLRRRQRDPIPFS